jgi:hypothetical protein
MATTRSPSASGVSAPGIGLTPRPSRFIEAATYPGRVPSDACDARYRIDVVASVSRIAAIPTATARDRGTDGPGMATSIATDRTDAMVPA